MRRFCNECGVTRWCSILASILKPSGATVRRWKCGDCLHEHLSNHAQTTA